MSKKSDLEIYFRKNNSKLIHKWNHYFDIYERHFNKFRNKEVVILEIGVSYGGSLQMWKEYFGGKAKIFGIDINSKCKELEEENIKIFIGSQSDRKFLRQVKKSIPKIDILIDDGGHTNLQQITSLMESVKNINNGGMIVVEDTHTSFMKNKGFTDKERELHLIDVRKITS